MVASGILDDVVSNGPSQRLRPATPAHGQVDLVKRGAEPPVVSLVKRVSLTKASPVRQPSPADLLARPAGQHRAPVVDVTRVFVTAVRAPRRGARATRAWARRPAGRVAVPGLLMAVLVLSAVVIGAVLPRATDALPAAGAPGGTATGDPSEAPEVVPPPGADLPFPDPSGTGAAGQPQSDVLAAWVAPMSVKTGIPVVALQAYAFAELALGTRNAGCNLRWTTLAGIGRNESNHGRSGGATLTNDGRAAPPIYGPALDGTNGNKSIPDTDGGQVDGDSTWDRAVGPMQFIPSTWSRYAIDADQDGRSDPHDIDDAALAAATYLCAGTRDLSTVDGWWAAILAYNNVQVYAQNVFNAANGYGISSRG